MGSWAALLVLAACLTVQATAYRRNSDGLHLPYIKGGVEADPNSIPHQVITYVEDEVWCSGSILDEFNILTAGHCCQYAPITHVVADEHSLSKAEGREQKIRVTTHIVPEQGGDVCILRLAEPLQLNDWVQKVRLPVPGFTVNAGTSCTVSGWGRTEDNVASDVLLYVNVTIASDQMCFEKWGLDNTTFLCAGGVPGMGSCNGDSGGPLICDETHQGVVSGGPQPCAIADMPGFYARTSAFVNWINEQLDKEHLP